MPLDRLFERSALLEIVVKNLYWRGRWLQALARLAPRRKAAARPAGRIDFAQVLECLRQAGIAQGDILIVHSSMSALKATGLDARQIVLALKGLVGDSGTLAMPAFPLCDGQPTGAELMNDKAYEKVLTYDVPRTRAWTGALASTMMQMPGAIRSRHPCNSMVALGPAAQAMMEKNIAHADSTPCGPGSSWEFCYRHGAKIVALGVDLAHSLTMIHVAEDAFEDEWPVRNWYRKRTFEVVDGGFHERVTVRERRHSWSIFYAERSFARDMLDCGIARTFDVDGLAITTCVSTKLIEFLRSRDRIAYPYMIPFLRHIRRRDHRN